MISFERRTLERNPDKPDLTARDILDKLYEREKVGLIGQAAYFTFHKNGSVTPCCTGGQLLDIIWGEEGAEHMLYSTLKGYFPNARTDQLLSKNDNTGPLVAIDYLKSGLFTEIVEFGDPTDPLPDPPF